MFNLRKNKYRTLNSYPDTWSVREAKLNGDDFVIRVCVGLREAMGHPDYQYQVGIATPLNWKTESGIASKVESESLQKLELDADETLSSEKTRFVAALTGRNMKELIFYTSDPEVVKNQIEELKAKNNSHEIQSILQRDPEWNTYRFIIGE